MSIQPESVSLDWGGRTLEIETGLFASLAGGSVTVRYGDTILLVTATMAKQPRPGMDFFPLTVDFEERMYAAGKIPGSRFIRRETRPSENAILNGRLIDRSIRPLFPHGALNDVQVVITTLAVDDENDIDIPGLVGASAALMISDIPFDGPIGGVKIGMVDGDLVVNPTHEQIAEGQLELVVAATANGVLMIESGASQVTEETMTQAIEMAYRVIQPVLELQNQLREKVGKAKKEMVIQALPEGLSEKIDEQFGAQIQEAVGTSMKGERNEALDNLREEAKKAIQEGADENAAAELSAVGTVFEELAQKYTRKMILEQGQRPDGRRADELREIKSKVSILPRVHGTGLFERGETQVLTIATLGSPGDGKIVDSLQEGEEVKRYLHHYNFPPSSVGETRPMRGPGRREIGHGALAEKALLPVLPAENDFPYVLRLVSEVLASNGSTSMAAVCGSTLALMDAGVPISAPVAGISIGLVLDENDADKRILLTDIIGMEDFYGDMDFKVAGTREGITAIQLDTKARFLPIDMMTEVFAQARKARFDILEVIESAIEAPRAELSTFAPRILTVNIPVDRIGEVIGPGGKNVRAIVEKTGAKIDIEDDGTVYISSISGAGADEAAKIIHDMTAEVEIGESYSGPVTRIMTFGAFVEILPGREGLIRISELDWNFVESVEDVLDIGDTVEVKVSEIDDQGRVNLSRKALMPKPEGYVERAPRESSSDRPRSGFGGGGNRGGGGDRNGGERDRGGRGGDRHRGGGGGDRHRGNR